MNRLLTLKTSLVALTLALTLPAVWAQAEQPTGVLPGMNEGPIHDAARMGTRPDVERLLKASAQNRDARTPLGASPLHYAAMNGDSGPLKALLAAGANPNARDTDGRTPLHMAAFATRNANAMLLLQAGADPMIKTNDGRDVLSMARKVRADELAGEISLWILKGCKPGKPVKGC
ncbi:MAG: ankyrin repeat domain-containing protein [Burkholderiales bacterium]